MAAKAQSNIIRRVEVTESHGHHGGAWKVAYADFMTAMMAFFLLLWILSSSDEQKLRGIAEYFTDATMPGGSGVLDGATLGPPGTLNASNGAIVARGVELGKIDDPSPAQWEVRDVTPTADPEEKTIGTTKGTHEYPAAGAANEIYQVDAAPDEKYDSAAAGGSETARDTTEPEQAQDASRFEALQAEIMQAMQNNPDLRPLQKNVIFEKTPEGLRIQIIDQEGKPMFSNGRAEMVGTTKELMRNLGQSLSRLPNRMVITGHTDAVPFADRKSYDNWDLSTDRANTTRRFLESTGVNRERIVRVSGKADTELLVEHDPTHPSNRRISILLQFQSTTIEKTKRSPHHQKPDVAEEPNNSIAVQTDPLSALPSSTDTVTRLNETVFENLRSALR